jgi:hypothetical protein
VVRSRTILTTIPATTPLIPITPTLQYVLVPLHPARRGRPMFEDDFVLRTVRQPIPRHTIENTGDDDCDRRG